MNSLCILIPVYNKLEYTKRCLPDIKENLSSKLTEHVQIVVIDDNSQDGTEKWIRDNFPDVIILNGNGELYWTGAMNKGIEYAVYQHDFKFVLLWNNDIVAGPEYFNNLFKIMEESPENIVGSKIMTLQEKDIVWSYGGFFNPQTGIQKGISNFNLDGKEYSKIKSVDWCTGMGTLIHKGIIKKIGWMDDLLFPQYFGDTDYSYRAKLSGFDVVIYPDLVLYNDTSNSGLGAPNSVRGLIKSLIDIRSCINLKTRYNFLKKHSTSKVFYMTLACFYFFVIGGFIKWKLLALFGLRRATDRFD